MLIPIPASTTDHEGTNTTVTLALLVAAQCPHGHNIAYTVPDVEDLTYYSNKAARWAQEHADQCDGKPAGAKAA
jgi:hypothetical protein